MALGRVKWFSEQKGYGFIAQEDGQEYFVHHSRIAGEGFRTLHEGERVEFTELHTEKGNEAADVTKV